MRRVLTGCSNCKRCCGSAAGNATVGTARLASSIMTGSFLIPKRKCGVCGHKPKDHK